MDAYIEHSRSDAIPSRLELEKPALFRLIGDNIRTVRDSLGEYVGGFTIDRESLPYASTVPLGWMNTDNISQAAKRLCERALSHHAETLSHVPPQRRLNAFLVQNEGDESLVAFVDNENLVHYYLPSKMLEDEGISAENQPFELDVYKIEVGGIVYTGHKIRSAARPESAYPEPLKLDDDRRKKLSYILSSDWNAKG